MPLTCSHTGACVAAIKATWFICLVSINKNIPSSRIYLPKTTNYFQIISSLAKYSRRFVEVGGGGYKHEQGWKFSIPRPLVMLTVVFSDCTSSVLSVSHCLVYIFVIYITYYKVWTNFKYLTDCHQEPDRLQLRVDGGVKNHFTCTE